MHGLWLLLCGKRKLDVEARLLSPCHAGHMHCWLPPWHLLSPALFMCCCCCCIQLCGHTTPFNPHQMHRSGGYTVVFLVRGTRTGWQRGEDRGLQTGPLWLRYTGKGAPRTRGGETGGASRSFGVIFLLCCDL